MGQSQSSGGHGPGGSKKDDKETKKKYEPCIPTRVGKRRKQRDQILTCQQTAIGDPHIWCQLKLLKLEEEEFIRNQE